MTRRQAPFLQTGFSCPTLRVWVVAELLAERGQGFPLCSGIDRNRINGVLEAWTFPRIHGDRLRPDANRGTVRPLTTRETRYPSRSDLMI